MGGDRFRFYACSSVTGMGDRDNGAGSSVTCWDRGENRLRIRRRVLVRYKRRHQLYDRRYRDSFSPKRVEFLAARLAKVAKNIDCFGRDHLAYLNERLIRFHISIDDLFSDLFGAGEHSRRGQDTHSANLGVKPDQCWSFGLFVLERVRVAFRCFLDEFFVKLLPADFLLSQPLRACLNFVEFNKVASTDVAPMAAPISAARAEMIDAFMRLSLICVSLRIASRR